MGAGQRNRGELRSIVDIERRIKLDLWYIDNWNIAADLRLFL